MKNESYLFERHYINQHPPNLNKAKYKYWDNMLGKDTVQHLLKYYVDFKHYLGDGLYTISVAESTNKFNVMFAAQANQVKTVSYTHLTLPTTERV